MIKNPFQEIIAR